MSKASAPGSSSQTFALVGGLDLVTPPIMLTPGKVIAGSNYEPRAEGYRRIEGLERLDGHTAPSAASYSYITFNTGNAALVAGQTVTGNTSGATGILLVNGVLLSGTYAGSNATGFLVLKAVTGVFQAAENLKVGGVTKCASTSVATDRGATNDTDDATWLAASVLQARTAIQPVPGGGPVRGAWFFGGYVWAFRDDLAVNPTKTQMFKATTAGWVLQALGYTLPFTAGLAATIVVGQTVKGVTSGATGVVSRVSIVSGTFATNDAAGALILSAVTGTFVAEAIEVGTTHVATIAAAPTLNVMAPGGQFEFVNFNFYGATYQGAMYAAYGTGPAFEWDGANFTPINTGAPDERPQHIAAHKNHLFLSYRNGQLTGSQAGIPQGYSGLLGATSFGLGTDITGLVSQLAGTLAVFSRSAISILSGSGSADFAMSPFTKDTGAVEWTLQNMGDLTFLDDGGVRGLSTTQAFGNFDVDTLTDLIQPYFALKKSANIVAIGSLRVRTKTQYRLYFSDGTGFAIFTGAKKPSILPFDYGARVPFGLSSGLDANNQEILLMSCVDGYVYQLDKGTSMDGDLLTAFLQFPFNNCGSPNQNKRFQKISVQASTSPVATLYITAAFSDGDPDQPAVGEQSFSVYGGGGAWDIAAWNNFFWSSRVLGRADAHIDGFGNNVSPTIITQSAVELPHTLSSMTVLFSMRGPIR